MGYSQSDGMLLTVLIVETICSTYAKLNDTCQHQHLYCCNTTHCVAFMSLNRACTLNWLIRHTTMVCPSGTLRSLKALLEMPYLLDDIQVLF